MQPPQPRAPPHSPCASKGCAQAPRVPHRDVGGAVGAGAAHVRCGHDYIKLGVLLQGECQKVGAAGARVETTGV